MSSTSWFGLGPIHFLASDNPISEMIDDVVPYNLPRPFLLILFLNEDNDC